MQKKIEAKLVSMSKVTHFDDIQGMRDGQRARVAAMMEE